MADETGKDGGETGTKPYQVGKGRPPLHTRFKPGQPPGPGRPKMSAQERQFREDLKTAEHILRTGAPRAAQRLIGLVESDDEVIALKACNLVLIKYAQLAAQPMTAARRLLTEGESG